ncbi:hypothetical protein MHK_007193 [Candidatus Magnetomorum sp. HK-1]|nr:hypothetical protein MHK_007193 [Candidatus Magnetomorum sp. HK-1]
MNHYKGIHHKGILKVITIHILVFAFLFFSGCMHKKIVHKKESYSAFTGLQHLLLLNCENITSNVNAGIFSASDQDADMISMALGVAFLKVPHIRLTQIPFSKDMFKSGLIPQFKKYDALMSASIWWQVNTEYSAETSKHMFDLMVQLKLYRKNENNTIQTRNFYFPVMTTEAMVIKNHLFFCDNSENHSESILQTDIIPGVSKNIFKLTQLNLKMTHQKHTPFLDNKSQILFESKAYYALIQYIIESRLANNNVDVIPLFLDARISDALKMMAQKNNFFNNSNSHPLYAKKYHTDLYILGLCLEKTGRIKKALEYYRFVLKNAPKKSKLSAEGVGRCLKKMEIRDHIQWSRVNTQSDAAFQLSTVLPVKEKLDQEKSIIEKQEPIAENISTITIQESEPVAYTLTPMEISRDDDIIAIQIMLDEWLSAWQSKKSSDYFRYYADNFQPEKNHSIESWKEERKERLKVKSIFVSIVGEADIKFTSDTDAIVFFVQDFESKGYYYKDRTKKKLLLKKINDSWKIYKEQVLDIIQ